MHVLNWDIINHDVLHWKIGLMLCTARAIVVWNSFSIDNPPVVCSCKMGETREPKRKPMLSRHTFFLFLIFVSFRNSTIKIIFKGMCVFIKKKKRNSTHWPMRSVYWTSYMVVMSLPRTRLNSQTTAACWIKRFLINGQNRGMNQCVMCKTRVELLYCIRFASFLMVYSSWHLTGPGSLGFSFACSHCASLYLSKTCQWIGYAELFLGVNVCVWFCVKNWHPIPGVFLPHTQGTWDKLWIYNDPD